MTATRSERRYVWPFPRADGAFDGSAIRLAAGQPFEPTKGTFILEAEEEAGDLAIELDLRVADGLPDQVGVAASQIDVLVAFLHPFSRKERVMERWPLKEIPSRWSFEVKARDYSDREFVILLAACLSQKRDRIKGKPERAWRRASILAEREFVVRRPVSPSLFRVENTSFRDRRWEEHAIWFVEFRDLDAAHEATPDEVVTVHLNKDLPALQFLWDPGATRRGPITRVPANMVRRLVGAGILSELAVTVLRRFDEMLKEDVDSKAESGSLTERVLSCLSSELGYPEETIIAMALDDPGGLSRRIQTMVGAGQAFGEKEYRDLISQVD